jgi:hypothetical protein
VVVADTDPLPSKTGVGLQARQLSCLTAAISETICAPRELNDTWELKCWRGLQVLHLMPQHHRRSPQVPAERKIPGWDSRMFHQWGLQVHSEEGHPAPARSRQVHLGRTKERQHKHLLPQSPVRPLRATPPASPACPKPSVEFSLHSEGALQ